MVRGSATGTIFMQDAPFVTGNGTSALFGPVVYTTDGQFKLLPDNWMLGGDVRSSRISFIIRGPEALGAVPSGLLELELAGGNQVTTVPGSVAVVRNAMGMPIGTAPSVTTSAQGDESLLPRMRTAYVDLTWAMGRDVLRVGQFHNLLLTMIAASAARPGTLGYPAGQIGWRSPGITYMRKFMVGEETNFDLALQINRNSWIDNVPTCPTGMGPPALNCVPHGVSLGEASSLPQVEARLMLQSGKAESPWLYYAPNVWQVYVIGHWDQKDLSGIGAVAAAPQRDTLQTLVIEGGFKLKLGPVQIAANGWWGQNAGGVYGNSIQIQTPDKPDVRGFGAWSQLSFSFTKNWTLWGFAGIDKPNQDEAILAGFTRLQNLQLHGMLSYTDGPVIVGIEWYHVATTNYIPPITAPGVPPTSALKLVSHANQPSVTVTYLF